MSGVDHQAEADRIVAQHREWIARIPSSVRCLGPTQVQIDPFRFTGDDAAAIDALVGDDLVVSISSEPETFAPGYCFCCQGLCRQEVTG